MAKRDREQAVRERRARKAQKKQDVIAARKAANGEAAAPETADATPAGSEPPAQP